MKKIGLLTLALILTLGTLGVGYAKWTTTVTVAGTVNTGFVQVGIRDTGTSDPSPAGPPTVGGFTFPANASEGTIDPRVNPLAPINANGLPNFVTPDKNVGATDSANGETKCICTGTQYYASVTETVTNAYPFYAPTTHLAIANCGSIPIKIDTVGVAVAPGSNADLLGCIVYAWTITPPPCTACVPPAVAPAPVIGSGNLAAFIAALDHFQIDQCGVLTIDLTEIFLECTPQTASGSFTITIQGSQYNEVAQ